MKIVNKTIEIKTKEIFDFIDLTKKIKDFTKESGVKNGLINVQLMHTSAALILNENEPLLIEDFKNNLENSASRNLNYRHDNLEVRTVNVCVNECLNGHSHCKAIHLLPSITLNLIKGEAQFGKWQSVMLVELDRSRNREIQVQVIGE